MLVSNCLTKEECEIIENRFLKYIKDFPDRNIDTSYLYRYNKKVYGICYPFKELEIDHKKIIRRLSNLVKENYTTNYKFSHSFLRNYYNGSFLPIHNDKNDLDLTLSVNIGGLENWPIHISNIHNQVLRGVYPEDIKDIYPGCDEYEELCNKFKKDYHSVITPKGCGIFCSGREYPHWRDPLQCEPDEYVIQIFFHWTKC